MCSMIRRAIDYLVSLQASEHRLPPASQAFTLGLLRAGWLTAIHVQAAHAGPYTCHVANTTWLALQLEFCLVSCTSEQDENELNHDDLTKANAAVP